MANADIIRELLAACDRWSAGAPDAAALARAIDGHLSALEGLGPQAAWESRRFGPRVVLAWFGPDPVHGPMPADRAAVDAVVRDLRDWLWALGGTAEPGAAPDRRGTGAS